MIRKVERHLNEVLIWDAMGSAPLILSKEGAVDLAKMLLDKAGQIKDEPAEEEIVV